MRLHSLVSLLVAVGVALGVATPASAQLVKPTPELIEKDVKALVAGGNGRTFALRRLDKYDGPLPERQEEVAALLLKLVKEDKSYDAMRALSVWATEAEL